MFSKAFYFLFFNASKRTAVFYSSKTLRIQNQFMLLDFWGLNPPIYNLVRPPSHLTCVGEPPTALLGGGAAPPPETRARPPVVAQLLPAGAPPQPPGARAQAREPRRSGWQGLACF